MIIIFLFIVIIFLLTLLSFVWPPESPWSPWWRTNRRIAEIVCTQAKIQSTDVVYELGSGDGEALLAIAAFSKATCIGIEIDPFRFVVSKIRNVFAGAKNVQFKLKDFKQVNLSVATVVYFYLVPGGIKRLMPKLEKELSMHTRIISYMYPLQLKPNSRVILTKEDKVNSLYYYKVKV